MVIYTFQFISSFYQIYNFKEFEKFKSSDSLKTRNLNISLEFRYSILNFFYFNGLHGEKIQGKINRS